MIKRGAKKSSSPVGGALLKVQDLHVATDTKEILHGVDVEVKPSETVVLLGPNGAGKSTLASAAMGLPGLRVTDGKMVFDGEDITTLPVDERARRGIFMAWQAPVEIQGVSTSELLLSLKCNKPLDKIVKNLGLSPFILQRELNVGLSGGEKKKLEILQMMALNPKLAILDETDSGLDVDAARTVSKAISDYQKETGLALLIVTHNARILQELKVDRAYVLKDGRIAKTGDGKLVGETLDAGFK